MTSIQFYERRFYRNPACLGSTLLGLLLFSGVALAQSPPDPDYVRQQVYPSYSAFKSDLLSIVGISDPVARESALDTFWTTLQNAGQVPYAQGNQFAFLYRGSGSSISFPGDLNSWNPSSSSAQATNFAGTNLWIREGTLPTSARTDYKIVVNSNWILDPANSLQMWGGFGPNNELRMPEYIFPQETVRVSGVPQGTLTGNILTSSTSLGYNVNYRVYTPAGYNAESLSDLPVVYVTDGHEYLADHLGSMVITLDNLIHDDRLKPAVAVFIDPRDPSSGFNRRGSEYTMNPDFAAFVADELAPTVDAAYRTDTTADGRTILGTSLGGLNAAYFGAERPDVFNKIAPQSPAFNYNPAIYTLYQNEPLQGLDIYMTAGTINDGSGGTTMDGILAAGGYDYTFLETNEGHSWGNWRALIAEMLIGLIGPPTVQGDYNGDGVVDGADYTMWRDLLGSTTDFRADGDGNNIVDTDDYAIWVDRFGQTGGLLEGAGSNSPSVPEPTTLPLLAALSIFLIGRIVSFEAKTRRRSSPPHLKAATIGPIEE